MNSPSEEQINAFYGAVGRRVKKARAEANLTQLNLSRRTGLTRSSIANLEAGRQRVQAHVLAIIAGTLDVDTCDLLAPAFGMSEEYPLATSANDDLERFSSTARGFVEAGLRVSSPNNGKLA